MLEPRDSTSRGSRSLHCVTDLEYSNADVDIFTYVMKFYCACVVFFCFFFNLNSVDLLVDERVQNNPV